MVKINETKPANDTILSPRVRCGRIVATPGALEEFASDELRACFVRHAAGDWGDLGDADKQANERALETGARIWSSYRFLDGRRLLVITEATDDDGERASTSLLTPDEY